MSNKFLAIVVYGLMILLVSCEDKYQKCNCHGFDDKNQLVDVICEDCDKGIKPATCDKMTGENYRGLRWEYNEGDVCLIPPPSLPENDGGG